MPFGIVVFLKAALSLNFAASRRARALLALALAALTRSFVSTSSSFSLVFVWPNFAMKPRYLSHEAG